MTTVTIQNDVQFTVPDILGTRVKPQLDFEFYRSVKVIMT